MEVPVIPGPVSRRSFTGALGAGLGSFLLQPVRGAEASLARGEPVDAIQLDSNENPYGPSPRALEAMTRAQAAAGRYPDAAEDAVRDAIARLHDLAPERVLMGCGSTEVLRMAAQAFLGTGKTVVAAEPTFEAVLRFARVTQAEAVTVPLTADFRHDVGAMARAVDGRTGLVYVCNPNNPTGTIVSGEELAFLLASVPPSVTVLVDEAYHHFVESPGYRSACELLERAPNLVVARTFSKIYGMAGMRLGYAVGSEAGVAAMQRHSFWNNVNVAALEAALASLEDRDLVPRQRGLINDTRRWLCSRLASQGRRVIPSEANFVMIHVGGDVAPLIAAFKERRILVGRRFASLPNWLRVSIGTRPEMEAFLAAFEQLVPPRAGAAA
jgi:histidinol-phosphate aminotransferase